jgi:SSS family solute:Na+ symporter
MRISVATSIFLFLPSIASAAEVDAGSSIAGGGLQVVDWIIIGLYAVVTIGLGWYYSSRQKSTEEYFVGSGNMNPVLIGVSLFASLLSTITYLSIPGETIGKGPVYLANYIAYPFIFLVVGYVLLPVYMKHRVTSAYELLEDRLGLSVRLLGASMFLILRLVWMSILTFLTAMAIAEMAGLDSKYIPVIVLLTGTVAIIYASIGGLRAVVITDLMQTVLLYSGAVLTIGIVTYQMGGFGWFPTQWHDTWDTQPLFSSDPSTRVTMLGTFISVFLWTVCTSGGDQVSIQRFMATKDVQAARRAIGIQLVVGCIVGVTLGLAGFALLGYFLANPTALPADLLVDKSGQALSFDAALKSNADKVFPRFIGKTFWQYVGKAS